MFPWRHRWARGRGAGPLPPSNGRTSASYWSYEAGHSCLAVSWATAGPGEEPQPQVLPGRQIARGRDLDPWTEPRSVRSGLCM
eukprot:4642096-Alexandrium_andersonii.AAC.1